MSRPIRFPTAAVISIPSRRSIARWKWRPKAPTSSTSAANRRGPARRTISEEVELARILPVLRRLQGRLKIPALHRHVESLRGRRRAGGRRGDHQRRQRGAMGPSALARRGAISRRLRPDARARPARHDAEGAARTPTSAARSSTSSRNSSRARRKTASRSNRSCAIPGFGFGKTLGHNLTLLRDLEAFRALRRPILVGFRENLS